MPKITTNTPPSNVIHLEKLLIIIVVGAALMASTIYHRKNKFSCIDYQQTFYIIYIFIALGLNSESVQKISWQIWLNAPRYICL